ncbi:MAG: hypothetical protein O3A46_06640, partial [Candidatus Poribacteria bacterium]|nr:hypothetical protein [Candidatus Poribacteria bacterium]
MRRAIWTAFAALVVMWGCSAASPDTLHRPPSVSSETVESNPPVETGVTLTRLPTPNIANPIDGTGEIGSPYRPQNYLESDEYGNLTGRIVLAIPYGDEMSNTANIRALKRLIVALRVAGLNGIDFVIDEAPMMNGVSDAIALVSEYGVGMRRSLFGYIDNSPRRLKQDRQVVHVRVPKDHPLLTAPYAVHPPSDPHDFEFTYLVGQGLSQDGVLVGFQEHEWFVVPGETQDGKYERLSSEQAR